VTPKQKVARLAAWSIAVALAVLALKTAAWWVTGSVALFSDALESVVNVIAAGIALYAIRVSQRPADAGHPFGHHKAEYLSAVIEGAMIIVAALLIFSEAFAALIEPSPLGQPVLGLGVNVLAGVLNGAWAFLLVRTGRAERSPALVADGRHLYADVVTSLGVIFGLLLALATGFSILDPLLAVAVGLHILREGWKLLNTSVQGLMDRALDEGEIAEVRAVINANAKGALEYHDLKTREAGRARFVEFHLVVPEGMSVGDAHDICDRIEDALKRALPGSRVVIHIEPEGEAKAAE
jgi:cation diffusion facilitator family transporter